MGKRPVPLAGCVATLILVLASQGVLQTADGRENIVGWWKMEDPAWTGKTGEVKDSSGRGNDLTAYGKGKMPAIVLIGKVKGGGAVRAAVFKASEHQCLMSRPDNEDLHVGWEDFTLAAWVKSTDPARRCAILGYQTSTRMYGVRLSEVTTYYLCGAYGYGFYQIERQFRFFLSGPDKGETWPFFLGSPNSDEWTYLAAVRQGDRLYFYVNGELSASKGGASLINPDPPAQNPALQSQSFLIGSGGTNRSGESFDGRIADVKLYRSALTPERIAEEYARLKDAFPAACLPSGSAPRTPPP